MLDAGITSGPRKNKWLLSSHGEILRSFALSALCENLTSYLVLVGRDTATSVGKRLLSFTVKSQAGKNLAMNGPTTGKQHTPFLPRKEDGNKQSDGTPHAPFSSPWKSTLLGGTQLDF